MPRTALFLASLIAVLFSRSAVIAAAKTDFSGSYTLTGGKGAFKSKGASWTIRVETFITTRTQINAPAVQIHTRSGGNCRPLADTYDTLQRGFSKLGARRISDYRPMV